MVPLEKTSAQGTVGAGLEHIPGDRGIANLNDVGHDPFEMDSLVRRVEVLLL